MCPCLIKSHDHEPLPYINKVFFLLIQQEQQNATPLEEDKIIIFLNKPIYKNGSSKFGSRISQLGRGR